MHAPLTHPSREARTKVSKPIEGGAPHLCGWLAGNFAETPWWHVTDGESLAMVSHLIPHTERGGSFKAAARKDEL